MMKLNMEDPAVASRYRDICRSDAYQSIGTHAVKGCIEFLSEHAAAIMDRISNTMKQSLGNYPQLPDATCTKLVRVLSNLTNSYRS